MIDDSEARRQKWSHPAVGTVEQPDEMIHLVRNEGGEIVDVGMDEFVELERMNNKYLKLTIIGKDENNPLVLVLESESKIHIRKLGNK